MTLPCNHISRVRRPARVPKLFAVAAIATVPLLLGGWTAMPRNDGPAAGHNPLIETVQYFGTINRVAVRDHELMLFHFASLNEDCTSVGHIEVRMTSPPQHGTFVSRDSKGYSVFPASNPRRVCNSRPVQGVDIIYRPAAGYLGPDAVSINVIFPTGTEQSYSYSLDVK